MNQDRIDDLILEIHRDVGVLRTQMDELLELKDRVQKLEGSKSYFLGFAAGISVVVTLILKCFGI